MSRGSFLENRSLYTHLPRKDASNFPSRHKPATYAKCANGGDMLPPASEFDGCMSHGDTYEEVFENIQDAR